MTSAAAAAGAIACDYGPVPTVAATALFQPTAEAVTHNVTLPASIAAGDLLLMVATFPGNTTITGPAGWNLLANAATGSASTDRQTRVWWKKATGSEGATVAVGLSGGVEAMSAVTYRITGWSRDPVAVNPVTGNSANPDPANLAPAYGWRNYLFLAAASFRGSSPGVSAFPTGYGNTSEAYGGTGGTNNVATAVGRKAGAAVADNPATFTLNGADVWAATTIAVGSL